MGLLGTIGTVAGGVIGGVYGGGNWAAGASIGGSIGGMLDGNPEADAQMGADHGTQVANAANMTKEWEAWLMQSGIEASKINSDNTWKHFENLVDLKRGENEAILAQNRDKKDIFNSQIDYANTFALYGKPGDTWAPQTPAMSNVDVGGYQQLASNVPDLNAGGGMQMAQLPDGTWAMTDNGTQIGPSMDPHVQAPPRPSGGGGGMGDLGSILGLGLSLYNSGAFGGGSSGGQGGPGPGGSFPGSGSGAGSGVGSPSSGWPVYDFPQQA
jgi:hypothetical protein